MILLEVGNRALRDTIAKLLDAEKRSAVDIVLADFDGVQFHVTTAPEQRNICTISIRWSASGDLKKCGADQRLKAIYGPFLTTPESGYDFSLLIDLDALSPEQQAKLPDDVAMFKRNLFASGFHYVFDSIQKGGNVGLTRINYRDNEALFIKPEGDRVTVIFSINFRDKDDIIYSNVFLQEFANVRKTISAAPGVLFSQRDAPLELKGVQGVYEGEDQGFVSFALFKGHLQEPIRTRVIDNVMMFRDYLHYHIKCSKAYLHTRMRLRVELLLQVLNRAKMKNPDSQKTTMGGKTFTRADGSSGGGGRGGRGQ